MAMNESDIVQMIKEALPDAEVQIEDLRGDGDAVLRSRPIRNCTYWSSRGTARITRPFLPPVFLHVSACLNL